VATLTSRLGPGTPLPLLQMALPIGITLPGSARRSRGPAMSNPYPGLRPFRAEEAALFFGREALAASVATRLRLRPLTVLFARRGVGKSSFLTCR